MRRSTNSCILGIQGTPSFNWLSAVSRYGFSCVATGIVQRLCTWWEWLDRQLISWLVSSPSRVISRLKGFISCLTVSNWLITSQGVISHLEELYLFISGVITVKKELRKSIITNLYLSYEVTRSYGNLAKNRTWSYEKLQTVMNSYKKLWKSYEEIWPAAHVTTSYQTIRKNPHVNGASPDLYIHILPHPCTPRGAGSLLFNHLFFIYAPTNAPHRGLAPAYTPPHASHACTGG